MTRREPSEQVPLAGLLRSSKPAGASELAAQVYVFIAGRGAKESDDQFAASMEALRQELAPAGVIERIMIDMIVYAADRLRRAVKVLAVTPPDHVHPNVIRYLKDADRSFWRGFRELGRWQKTSMELKGIAQRPRRRKAGPSPIDLAVAALDPNVSAPLPDWRGRIALVRSGATAWPTVKETSIRAATVLSMVEEQWPVETILRALPGLSAEDVRACLACERAGKSGPFRPWHEPGAFERD